MKVFRSSLAGGAVSLPWNGATVAGATDLATDSSGNVYVTDVSGSSSRIQKFTAAGVLEGSWPGPPGFATGLVVDNAAGVLFLVQRGANSALTASLGTSVA